MTNHELIEIHLNNSDLNLKNLAGIAKISVNAARAAIKTHYDPSDYLEYPYFQLERRPSND